MNVSTRKHSLITVSSVVEKTAGIPLKIKIFIAFGTIYVIWGTTYLAIRFAIETIPPFIMMGCRFLSAGTVLYLWARFRGQANPRLEQWRTATVVGTLLFLGGHGALAWSEQVLPSGVAALIVATVPIWMILFAYFRNPVGKISGRVILGLALGFLGMVLLVEPSKLFGGQSVDLAGAAVLLFGTVSWSSGSVYSKYANLPKSPLLVSGMTMLCGGTALVLVGLLAGEASALASVSALSLVSLFYLILFGSIIAFTAYIWLLNTVSPAQVSTYAFVNPIIAVFVGWFGGGELLSLKILTATILMVAGVVAIVSRKSETRHSAVKDRKDKNPKDNLLLQGGKMINQELYRRLESKGYRARIVSSKRISDLKKKETDWREQNLLDKDLIEEWLTDFVFELPDCLAKAESIVVVASPQPHRRVSFILNDTTASFLIPSHYSDGSDAEVAKILDDYALSQNFRFEKAALPSKILAVCSGLAEYGKNNIAYVRGIGSYFRLSAFYSDLPPDADIWLEPRMMERCRNCVSCQKNCPTQAICSERFLLQAERCITFHNERKKDFPFWLQPSWHNCLVGCLYCQQCCPENKAKRDWIENSWVFSKEETSWIMKREPKEKLPKAMVKKLELLGMLRYYEILPRNLKALLAKKSLTPEKES